MTQTLTDSQLGFAGAVAEQAAERVIKAIKPAEPARPALPDIKALLAQAPAGTAVSYGDCQFTLPAAKPTTQAATGAAPAVETAEVGARPILGALTDPLDKIKVFKGIPVGSVLLGAGLGVVINETINGLQPRRVPATAPETGLKINGANIAYKAGVVVALTTVGNKVLPKEAVVSAVTVIGADVLATLLPVNIWACKLANFFLPEVPATGAVAGVRYKNPSCDTIAPLQQAASARQQLALGAARQNYPLITAPSNDILAGALGGGR